MAAVSAQLRELVPERPGEELLPVLPVVSGLLQGGLRRGCIVAVERSRLLCMAVAAGVSVAGGWCAVVGMPRLGVLAAADAGLDMDRLLLVPDPGPRWPQVVAALLEGCELVVLRPPGRPSAQVARRLAGHVRHSGGALVVAGGWDGANLWLRVARSHWVGAGAGHGRLRGRRAQIVAGGRGLGARSLAQWWWLPGPDGAVTATDLGTAERLTGERNRVQGVASLDAAARGSGAGCAGVWDVAGAEEPKRAAIGEW
jgi:hypothetical protein